MTEGTEVSAQARPQPALIWWSATGAAEGTPWRVQHFDGTTELFAAVRITGTVEFRPPPEGELPDGPRGVAVLIDGTLVAGK